MTQQELLEEIDSLRSLMAAVATGGPRIQDVNEEYKARRQRVRDGLRERGLTDPNPFPDLWRWYGKWSSGDLPSYRSRREFISDLYAPLVENIQHGLTLGTEAPEPTGWVRVDRGLSNARGQLATASSEEEFQTVGLLCREVLISLAQAVYEPGTHAVPSEIAPSETDAKRMLDAYIAKELSGGPNEEARRHAKAALDLANALQHRRTASFRDAAMCAEATTAVVNLIAIVSGRRDPDAA